MSYTYELRQASTTGEYAVISTDTETGRKEIVFKTLSLSSAKTELAYFEKAEKTFQATKGQNHFSVENIKRMVKP